MKHEVDQLAHVEAKYYVGLEHRNFDDQPVFMTVKVPRYFKDRLERVNTERERRDREALDLRDKIIAFRKRVYSSRTFPPALRAIIFERDSYTCQVCLRDRAALLARGLHLECDHIQEWEDGGQTTLDNGQTLCDECNKAKHHAKHYLGMIAHVRSAGRR